MKIQLFAYVYEYSLDRDTGEVTDPQSVHFAQGDPMENSYIDGAVSLGKVEVDLPMPSREDIAKVALRMLDAKAEGVKEEATRTLEAIADKRTVYLALTHQPDGS